MSDNIIKVTMDQAATDPEILKSYMADVTKHGLVVELIAENYDEDRWWDTAVQFTMNANDLYKIPDIIAEPIIMYPVEDADNKNSEPKEMCITIYNGYIE